MNHIHREMVKGKFCVLRFDQAVIWQYDLRSQVSIEAVSGLAEVAPEAPYVQWLARAAVHVSESPGQPVVVSALADLPDALADLDRAR